MKALLSLAAGGPETLVFSELPMPQPGPGEIVVAVRACGLNFPDVLMLDDLYQVKPPRPFAPGGEIAGIVHAVGAGVTDLHPGQAVFGPIGHGGLAEYVVMPAIEAQDLAAGIDFCTAAGFLLTYRTAYHGLKDRAELRQNETVLVLGAAGGVGLATVELAKALGGRVLAAASSPEKLEIALRHGASDGLVYPPGPLAPDTAKRLSADFKALCGPRGAEIIVDPVGGDYADAAIRAIAYRGRYLTVGFPAGIPRLPLNLPLLKSCQVIGVYLGAFARNEPDAERLSRQELANMLAVGRLKPLIGDVLPFERAIDALKLLQDRKAKGKVVVSFA